MSLRNPGCGITPQVVLECASALEVKLGRPAYVRQVKNRDEWFISDPMFSFVQHGLRKGATGYRVGYFYSANENELAFYLVHSPVMAQLFKKNLHLSAITHAVEGCSSFLTNPRMIWSSRIAKQDGEKDIGLQDNTIEFLSFLREVDERRFIADLFPKIENQKTGIGSSKWAGHDFFLLLAEQATALLPKNIRLIIEASWPLFLCLYPVSAIERRVASLARNLAAAKLPKVCEYHHIANCPKATEISPLCRGAIEGAHIKPHALGGADMVENGLWLCQYHHRETEGLLAGSRNGKELNVRFVSA